MQDKLEAVDRFHKAFGLGRASEPTTEVSGDTIMLRHRLMAEENDEYLEAASGKNLAEVADALGDMLYILCGTIIEHGMQEVIDDVFKAIQASNMSKLGRDGKPIYREDGKVMKGPGYFKPDLEAVLERVKGKAAQKGS